MAAVLIANGFVAKALPAIIGGFALGGVSAVFYGLNVGPFHCWRKKKRSFQTEQKQKRPREHSLSASQIDTPIKEEKIGVLRQIKEHKEKKHQLRVELKDVCSKLVPSEYIEEYKDYRKVGFLGPNDAGKSTCINTILGHYEAQTGKGVVTGDVTFYRKDEFKLLLVDFPGRNDTCDYEDEKILAVCCTLDLACILFPSTATLMAYFIELLEAMTVPFVCVLTKVDEWSGEDIARDVAKIKRETLEYCSNFKNFQGFYAINAKGDECYETTQFFNLLLENDSV
jgi:small GTP-binding protein